jgi:hypothetical protein
MSEIDVVDTGVPAPRISQIWVVGKCRLGVSWAEGYREGRTEEVDLSSAIGSYTYYRPLRNDHELFKTAHLVNDGYAVAWGNDSLDMSAETIENIAQESRSPQDFADFLIRNNLTQAAAASILGRSRRQIGYYLSPGPVPRVIALACHGYEALKRIARRDAEKARERAKV